MMNAVLTSLVSRRRRPRQPIGSPHVTALVSQIGKRGGGQDT